MRIELVQFPTEEVIALVGELEAELSGDFAAHQRHGYDVERIFRENVLFFVARMGRRAVGCGGIAFEEGYAEVKRMYVRKEWRGRGIGKAMLERLERETRERGVEWMKLETGDVLHSAIGLYERAGFVRCGVFGTYAKMEMAAIERSVFMEKRIDGSENLGR